MTPESAAATVSSPVPERRAPVPPEPSTIADTGLSYEALKQLLTKALHAGELSGLALSEKLCLPYSLLESLLDHLRVEKMVEVRGAAGSGTAGFRFALTDFGRERAGNYFDANGYVGPAPVPLHQYTAAMNTLKEQRGFLTRERIAHGFTHLIVSPQTLDQLGPAVNSGKSIFLYGPPGNGKTVVAEGIGRALGGDMYVPWALDIDGQIITIFDPVNHTKLDDEETQGSVIRAADRDRRWVRIRRPVVTVGGELTLEMLDSELQPDREVLRGAAPAEGQRRRLRRRRLRPPAHPSARPAEPLDRAARVARGLPDAAHRARSSRCRSTC